MASELWIKPDEAAARVNFKAHHKAVVESNSAQRKAVVRKLIGRVSLLNSTPLSSIAHFRKKLKLPNLAIVLLPRK